MSVPKAPGGLSAGGRRLWRAVLEEHDLRPDELLLLEKTCRTASDLDRLEAAMADEPLVTEGSTGQLRAHPLLAEVRGMRQLLVTQLRQLAIPDDAVQVPEVGSVVSATTSKARTAARARWGTRSA